MINVILMKLTFEELTRQDSNSLVVLVSVGLESNYYSKIQ